LSGSKSRVYQFERMRGIAGLAAETVLELGKSSAFASLRLAAGRKPFWYKTMKFEFADLSKEGLILYPRPLEGRAPSPVALKHTPQDFLDQDRDLPELVGTVPNLRDFACGGDYNVGAFEIKAQGSNTVCVPSNLPHLLPTTALIIDDFYHHAGTKVADQCQISLQFFRTNYEAGEHLLFDRIHRHAQEGKMVIYVVTAVDPAEGADPNALGTEFYSASVMGKRISRAKLAASAEDFQKQYLDPGVIAAPGGAIIRFSETTLHAAPDITHVSMVNGGIFGSTGRKALRRSLLNIIASYKQDDGTVYGRSRPPNDHRETPVEHIEKRHEDYRAAAERAMEEIMNPDNVG